MQVFRHNIYDGTVYCRIGSMSVGRTRSFWAACTVAHTNRVVLVLIDLYPNIQERIEALIEMRKGTGDVNLLLETPGCGSVDENTDEVYCYPVRDGFKHSCMSHKPELFEQKISVPTILGIPRLAVLCWQFIVSSALITLRVYLHDRDTGARYAVEAFMWTVTYEDVTTSSRSYPNV